MSVRSRHKLVLALTGMTVLTSFLPPAVASVRGQASDNLTYDWPMFHADPQHTGYSAETTLTASNASSLGLQWMVNTGASTFNAPAVAYNATLNKTVVYTASSKGVISAYDARSGERIWWYKAAASVTSSPAIVDGVLYIGAADYKMRALDAVTGSLICSMDVGGVINGSPTVVDPGGGKVIYFGDSGFGGNSDGGHIWAINAVDANSAPDCSMKWMYDQFGEPPGSQPLAGSWSPPAFATTASGRKVIVQGASSPDNSVYALDALTGARVWRFQTQYKFSDSDVGAGPTVSAPGFNGFAQGVAYAIGKSHVLYALNLTTGAEIWHFDMNLDSPNFAGSTRSTPALVGDRLYVGYGEGMYAFNAITGTKLWKWNSDQRQEVVSSPAVTGAGGDQVIYAGDLSGHVYALGAATGSKLWSYDTGGYIYGSSAVSGGRMYIGSSDGFLYSFGLGGGSSAKPTTVITSPVNGSTIANPNGNLEITGSAADDVSVTEVLVGVKSGSGDKWWNASTRSWDKIFVGNPAILSAPDSLSTDWTLSVPLPATGGNYFLQAEAVDGDGQHTAPVATTRVAVRSSTSPPDTAITSPKRKQLFYLSDPPGALPITVTGTAVDTAGTNPGVARVKVIIRNIEHNEYYCGPAGCPGAPSGVYWRTTYTSVDVTPDNPGATSVSWSLTFPAYDHPHKYYIGAQAVDRDGEVDPFKAKVSPICVRYPGHSCSA